MLKCNFCRSYLKKLHFKPMEEKETSFMNFDTESLIYHKSDPAGKIEVRTTKDVSSEHALSLAYSPGVAAPCIEISKDPSKVYEYTTKGNLVAVITNGTAVLGLGDIGPMAGKPVMEGKGILFKKFADINVFDIEIDTKDVDEFVNAVKLLEPTFGGINLEDISSPECFEIERRLKEEMNIPVFHDDQHGTAIITAAALLNACELSNKKISEVKVVFNGAGAAAISCARLFIDLGVNPKKLWMCDSKGLIQTERTHLNDLKKEFSKKSSARSLKDILKDADVFCGLSVAGVLDESMLKSMAKDPIIFAMANPNPEVDPALVEKVRPDAIMATGRSDYPNQVNNVLGFPYIFRGALDVRATHINEKMKLAAVHAIAALAKKTVPAEVSYAYDHQEFHFGKDYIIPKPFDSRVLLEVAPAVAQAAMDSGVAQIQIKDLDAYQDKLESSLGIKKGFIRQTINKVKSHNRKHKIKTKIVFPEGESKKVLKAAETLLSENFCDVVLLGNTDRINGLIKREELLGLENLTILDPEKSKNFIKYTEEFHELRCRKGLLKSEAKYQMEDPYYYSAMMLKNNEVHGLISGASRNYASCVRPLLETLGTENQKVASGVVLVLHEDQIYFLTDTTMVVNPTAEQMVSIAKDACDLAAGFGVSPKVAMLSYTNFLGDGANPNKMKKATESFKKLYPEIPIDGEMQGDSAVDGDLLTRLFPFSELAGDGANVLVFPNLDSANISYKLLQKLSELEVVGPLLLGLDKPVNIVQRTGDAHDIVNATALTCLEYFERLERQP